MTVDPDVLNPDLVLAFASKYRQRLVELPLIMRRCRLTYMAMGDTALLTDMREVREEMAHIRRAFRESYDPDAIDGLEPLPPLDGPKPEREFTPGPVTQPTYDAFGIDATLLDVEDPIYLTRMADELTDRAHFFRTESCQNADVGHAAAADHHERIAHGAYARAEHIIQTRPWWRDIVRDAASRNGGAV